MTVSIMLSKLGEGMVVDINAFCSDTVVFITAWASGFALDVWQKM